MVSDREIFGLEFSKFERMRARLGESEKGGFKTLYPVGLWNQDFCGKMGERDG